ncbi:hypothetical protein QI724_004499 [Vibrio parahaemolyticus]|nr:hypothetical protein [Vibrio parahaemolyticus]
MKILFITSELSFSNTSAAIRNRILLNGLLNKFEVDVYEVKQFKNAQLEYSIPNEVNAVFVHELNYISSKKSKPGNPITLLRKIKDYFRQQLKTILPDKITLAKLPIPQDLNLESYHYVISSSDPKGIHFATINLLKSVESLFKGKYIQYWGDPWYDDISKKTNKLTLFLEKRCLKLADFILYNSPKTVERQKKLFPSLSDSMLYLPRGVYDPTGNYTAREGNYNNLKFVYAGDYYKKYRSLEPFLTVACERKLDLCVYGDGDINHELFPEVTFFGRVSKQKLDEEVKNASIQVIVLNSFGGQIPGKLFDLMLSSSRLLLIIDGDFNIEDIPLKERFYICDNNNVSINSIIDKVLDISESNCFDLCEMSISSLVTRLFDEIELR